MSDIDERAGNLVDAIVEVIDMRIVMSFASENSTLDRNKIITADFESRSKLMDEIAIILKEISDGT